MSVSVTEKKKSKRIFYFDALRALAIIAVIGIHVAARSRSLILSHYDYTLNFQWLFGDFFWACLPIGVALFLMLSGALSLGRDWDIRSFLGKRIPRIVGPFVFWGTVLSLFAISVQYFFPDFLQVVEGFDFHNIFSFIIGAWTSQSWGFGPYWFFWMILGTYLIMPIFNKWLLHADLKEAEYFLAIWLITCIFDYTLFMDFPIKISYFSGPIGMVVLGYYLRYTERKIFTNKIVPLILIIIAISCELYLSFLFSTPDHMFKFDRYSIFSAIEVIGIFLLFRNLSDVKVPKILDVPNEIFHKAVFSIAKYSYGFYLIHEIAINLTIRLLRAYNLYVGYETLLIGIFILSLGACWIVMALLNRIPYVNQVIGAK